MPSKCFRQSSGSTPAAVVGGGPPELIPDGRRNVLERVKLVEIQLECVSTMSCCGQRFAQPFRCGFVDVASRDGDALCSQRLSDGATQSAASAHDDGDVVIDSKVHFFLL